MTLAIESRPLDPVTLAAHLARISRVHVVGIGGSGTSGLARVLKRRGLHVTGSDGRANETTAALEAEGIPVAIGHRAETIDFASGLVVASAAVPDDNPELAAARAAGVPVAKYAETLAAAVAMRRVIAIAGCHGKTTTSSLTAFLLRRCGIDCGFVVGGQSSQLGGNAGEGHAPEFVVEACEYDRSFLRFTPAAAAITNVDADHLDYFGSMEAVIAAFKDFAGRVRDEGLLVTTRDVVDRVGRASMAPSVRVRTVGDDASDSVRIAEMPGDGPSSMRMFFGREDLGRYEVSIPGRHNLGNAAMAIVLALEAGADLEKVRYALPEFKGVSRRMTIRMRTPALTVIDDYGHHPTELRATLAATRAAFRPTRLVLIFQPHQYSRTRLLFDDFVEALRGADRVILPEIYAARDSDEDRRAVSSADLAKALVERGVDAVFAPRLDDATRTAWDTRRIGDVVLTSGAGDVDRVADELVRRAGAR